VADYESSKSVAYGEIMVTLLVSGKKKLRKKISPRKEKYVVLGGEGRETSTNILF